MSSTSQKSLQRPVTLLICALGGEGGGVLVEWLVRTATACGFAAQSTSIPGVAQRTGSTTYYIEIYPVPLAELNGKRPVFSLYPVPGALDILVSSELLETVRQIGNGMVSPDRTRVLTSTSRTLTTAEKMQLGDGRASTDELLELVSKFSRAYHAFDMSSLARDAGTVVSAVLMGAIAGSGLLMFPRDAFEATIRQSKHGVDASLKGFAGAFDAVRQSPVAAEDDTSRVPVHATTLPQAVSATFPDPVRDIVALGHVRMIEYQDRAYAKLYLDRLTQILGAEKASDSSRSHDFAVTREVARYLALWMAFDDIVRVADLKSSAGRLDRIRREVNATPDESMRVYDFFKPGIPEFAGLLPQRAAMFLLNMDKRRREAGKSALALPLKVPTHSVSGFVMLRALAKLRCLRKRSLRYAQEQSMIERWLECVATAVRSDWQLGYEVAMCGRLIKGYGTTNERGKANLLYVLDHLMKIDFDTVLARAAAIRAVRDSALADDTGKALDQTLVEVGAPPGPGKAQPVIWMKKPGRTAARASIK